MILKARFRFGFKTRYLWCSSGAVLRSRSAVPGYGYGYILGPKVHPGYSNHNKSKSLGGSAAPASRPIAVEVQRTPHTVCVTTTWEHETDEMPKP